MENIIAQNLQVKPLERSFLGKKYFFAFVISNGLVYLLVSTFLFWNQGWLFGTPGGVAIFFCVILFFFNLHKVRIPLVYGFIFLSYVSYFMLIFFSGGMKSPFIFWIFTVPLMSLLLTKRIVFLIVLVFTLLSMAGLFLLESEFTDLQSLIQLHNPKFIQFVSNFSLVAYWLGIFYIRERSQPSSLHRPQDHAHISLDVENKRLADEVRELSDRNARLVRLYDNLKRFEIAGEQKTEILAEAARILDIKNKQIRSVRDDYMQQSRKLEELHEDLTNSIRYAQKIQEAITPESDWVVEHFRDAFIYYQPKDIVSGDFYWFEEIKTVEGRIKVLIAADCTGHGVPGAFMTVIGHSLINEIVHEMRVTRPDVLLKELDRKIIDMLTSRNGKSEIHDGMDMVALMIDESNQVVQYAAAHNPLFYVRKQELEIIKGSRYPVGSSQYRTEKSFKLHTIQAQPNDVFYIFTDGFQDQFGEKEERKYMTRKFRNLLLSINRLPLGEQKKKLHAEFEAWKGKIPQTDDVLIIGFRM
ncbi:MAG: SpoIIE family protein phosphatase [Microscillaceae bacterium]|nr:SpoIIE family protein phosphatase [Microscillaceae bacterium]